MADLAPLAQRLTERFDLANTGMSETAAPGVMLYYVESPIERGPLVYQSGIVFIISGRKVAYLGGRDFHYDSQNYLTLGLPLAIECEAMASKEEPLLAIFVSITPALVREVASAMKVAPTPEDLTAPSIQAAPFAGDMQEAAARLMRMLDSGADAAILGESAVREIVYRALQGPAASALRGLLYQDGHTSRIAQVMQTLESNFAERFSVDDMAQIAGMSASVFHRAFREATDETPTQYLKKLRLAHGRRLLMDEGFRVGVAATAVGYVSAAQFSRDFKGHFGFSPADARSQAVALAR